MNIDTDNNPLGRNPNLRKAILQRNVETNDVVANQDILEYLKSLGFSTDYKNLHELHLKKLTDVLDGPMPASISKGGRALLGYKLKKDLYTVKFLLKYVYEENNYQDLMNSEYYRTQIPDIIDALNQKLIKINEKPIAKSKSEQILHKQLKYTPTGLNLILSSKEELQKALERFKETMDQNFGKISDTPTHETKKQVTEYKINHLIDQILDCDLYMGYINSEEFENDRINIKNELKV